MYETCSTFQNEIRHSPTLSIIDLSPLTLRTDFVG